MKRFAKTRFFLLMKKKDSTFLELEDEYEKFTCCLFAENVVCTNKETYHNALVYAHAELSSLTKVAGKKCKVFFWKSHSINRQTN
jgi:hypothetical protein